MADALAVPSTPTQPFPIEGEGAEKSPSANRPIRDGSTMAGARTPHLGGRLKITLPTWGGGGEHSERVGGAVAAPFTPTLTLPHRGGGHVVHAIKGRCISP